MTFKLREKQLHPLLVKLGIPRSGFHSMRHGAASGLLADSATPAVVQRQLRHRNPGLRWESTVMWWEVSSATRLRIALHALRTTK